MQAIIDKIKGMWATDTAVAPEPQQKKTEIEGYLMSGDGTKSLLLVNESNNYWRTQWFDDALHTYKAPLLPISEVFMKRN
jgi:hypothetical protein